MTDPARSVTAWSLVSTLLGVGMLLASRWMAGSADLPTWNLPALGLLQTGGAATLALGAAALVFVRTRWGRGVLAAVDPGDDEPRATSAHPYRALFWISFVALFVEVMLIRYCNTQLRVFAFYKNVPLIGAFLGLGLGCVLGRGRSRHALLFLLWLFPIATFLSTGSIGISRALSRHAAFGSSEQILGDFVPREVEGVQQLVSQLVMANVSVAALVVLTLLFTLLGRLLGQAFERVERLPGYTVNILGSLAGVVAFAAASYLELPPAIWFAAGLLPLLLWMPGRGRVVAALVLIALNVAAVWPSWGDTVWSRYQKLVGHAVPEISAEAYRVEISDVFYQMAVDRRPESLAQGAPDLYPHYDAIYRSTGLMQRVLIVGAGTGNDVAAALRAGVVHVDAVEIDPAIVKMGRRHHPERPYDDSRVRVIVDDARHAFRDLEPQSYDAVVFGLLDSHTQLGMSSVRLDNYVFTLESFAEAYRLVRPGGYLVVTAATYQPWFYVRIGDMLRQTVGSDVLVNHHGAWWTWLAPVDGSPAGAAAPAPPDLPTDDWPFLYLPGRRIPGAYLLVLAGLVLASVVVLRLAGLPRASFSRLHGHLFFLGAAFLLMEVHAINRLALLFGTTWIVSAVAIVLVLLLIVAANLTVTAWPRIPYVLSYPALGLALAASFLVRAETVLGAGTPAAVGLGLLVLSPVFFAGLVFARSFRGSSAAGPALGANILGSVLGGWIEYTTMALGIRALVLLAAGFYTLSLLLLVLALRPRRDASDRI